ncbi:MAG TPA: TauD/TfdA family dioxygenase [Flavilitoribacter sp.]|nr:TauD/TfdA family dioxygenase [Flavilitoribacter sp.]
MSSVETFPYVWANDAPAKPDALPALFTEQHPEIKKILLDTGAILFKSFGIDSPAKLQRCIEAFPGSPVNYVGGNSPRTNLEGKVYTSTEQAAHSHISLHNELSYAHTWPRYIFFCCEKPAEEGGFTIIADSRRILSDLPASVSDSFRGKGVSYIRNLHGGAGAGPSWQGTFETEQPENVEHFCRENDIRFEWKDRKKLRLTENRAAVIRHPETGEEVWFNQADQFHPSTNEPEVFEALMELYEEDPKEMPQYVCFNDGSDIPLEMLDQIRAAGDKNTVYFNWEKGDLLLLDNILTAHGRTPYKGSRSILVAMLS